MHFPETWSNSQVHVRITVSVFVGNNTVMHDKERWDWVGNIKVIHTKHHNTSLIRSKQRNDDDDDTRVQEPTNPFHD